MKVVRAHLAVLVSAVAIAAASCAGDRLTTTGPEGSPLPPGPSPRITLRGFVVDESGVCVEGATVRIEQGQGLDQSAAQQTPCDIARQSGGFELRDLVPNLQLAIRASATGYVSRVITLIPTAGLQAALHFILIKEPGTQD